MTRELTAEAKACVEEARRLIADLMPRPSSVGRDGEGFLGFDHGSNNSQTRAAETALGVVAGNIATRQFDRCMGDNPLLRPRQNTPRR